MREPLAPITQETAEVGMLVVLGQCSFGPEWVDPDTVYRIDKAAKSPSTPYYELTSIDGRNITRMVGGTAKLYLAPESLVNPKHPETEMEWLVYEIRMLAKKIDRLEHTVHQHIPTRSR